MCAHVRRHACARVASAQAGDKDGVREWGRCGHSSIQSDACARDFSQICRAVPPFVVVDRRIARGKGFSVVGALMARADVKKMWPFTGPLSPGYTNSSPGANKRPGELYGFEAVGGDCSIEIRIL